MGRVKRKLSIPQRGYSLVTAWSFLRCVGVDPLPQLVLRHHDAAADLQRREALAVNQFICKNVSSFLINSAFPYSGFSEKTRSPIITFSLHGRVNILPPSRFISDLSNLSKSQGERQPLTSCQFVSMFCKKTVCRSRRFFKYDGSYRNNTLSCGQRHVPVLA